MTKAIYRRKILFEITVPEVLRVCDIRKLQAWQCQVPVRAPLCWVLWQSGLWEGLVKLVTSLG